MVLWRFRGEEALWTQALKGEKECWKNGLRVVGYVVERVANAQAFVIYS